MSQCGEGITCRCQKEPGHHGRHQHTSNGVTMTWKNTDLERPPDPNPCIHTPSRCNGGAYDGCACGPYPPGWVNGSFGPVMRKDNHV